jgi:hypothetical protein
MARDRKLDLIDISLLHEFVGQGIPRNLRHTLDMFEHIHKGKRTERLIGESAIIYPFEISNLTGLPKKFKVKTLKRR